jgi:hypothetical protein
MESVYRKHNQHNRVLTEHVVCFDKRSFFLESTKGLLSDAHGKESIFDFALFEWFLEDDLDSLFHCFAD